jgi:hypothetical protein
MDKPSDRDLPEAPDPASEEGGAALGEVSIRRIQIINLCLLCVTALASLRISQAFALGVVAGGVLMAGNFGIIVSVIRAVFLKGQASALKVGLYWFKFAAVMLIAGVLILVFRVDVIGLLVGLSTILVAIVAEALLRLAYPS